MIHRNTNENASRKREKINHEKSNRSDRRTPDWQNRTQQKRVGHQHTQRVPYSSIGPSFESRVGYKTNYTRPSCTRRPRVENRGDRASLDVEINVHMPTPSKSRTRHSRSWPQKIIKVRPSLMREFLRAWYHITTTRSSSSYVDAPESCRF